MPDFKIQILQEVIELATAITKAINAGEVDYINFQNKELSVDDFDYHLIEYIKKRTNEELVKRDAAPYDYN